MKPKKIYVVLRMVDMAERDGVVGRCPCYLNKKKAVKAAQGAAIVTTIYETRLKATNTYCEIRHTERPDWTTNRKGGK